MLMSGSGGRGYLVEHEVRGVRGEDRDVGASAREPFEFGQQDLDHRRTIGGLKEGEEPAPIDAVEDDLRVAAVGAALLVACSEVPVVVDRRGRRDPADYPQRPHGTSLEPASYRS